MKRHAKSAALIGALLVGTSSAASVDVFSIDGVDYVMPFFLAQALGGTFKESGGGVAIAFGKTNVQLAVNSKKAKVNNDSATLNTPVVAMKDIIFVPLKDFLRVTKYKGVIAVKSRLTLNKEQLNNPQQAQALNPVKNMETTASAPRSPAVSLASTPVSTPVVVMTSSSTSTTTASADEPESSKSVPPDIVPAPSEPKPKPPYTTMSVNSDTGERLLQYAQYTWSFSQPVDAQSAYDTCIQLVTVSLKSPASARFDGPASYSFVTIYPNNVWGVSGTVDAQNSYGALIRNHYNCVIKDGGRTQTPAYVSVS